MLFLVLSVWLLAGPAPAAEMQTLAPAIMVNDQVISALEVEMRIKLALVSSGLQDAPETRDFIDDQVEQQLIDEKLQVQEAQRLGVSVPEEQVEQTFAQIAQGNGISAEELEKRLRASGILPEYLTDQIRARLLWRAVMQNQLLPRITVDQTMVDDAVARIQERAGEPQRLLAEIVLSIDNASQTQQVLQRANDIIEQIRGGAGFQAIARQLSESPTAPAGGDLGWVDPGTLPPEVEQVIDTMEIGQLSDPIRTPTAIYIMLLREERPQPERLLMVSLKVLGFAVSNWESREAVNRAVGRATEAARALSSCEQAESVAKRFGGVIADLPEEINVADLPGPLRTATSDLPIGKPSELFRAQNGIGVAIVCARKDSGIDQEAVRERLIREQMDRLSRRYMQDLRRLATIEMRS